MQGATYMDMQDFETKAAQQFFQLKSVTDIKDIPSQYLTWHYGKGWVYFTFTGMFRKVQKGEYNRRIANRNRAKLFVYEPEFEFEGQKFSLPIICFKSVPEHLIV